MPDLKRYFATESMPIEQAPRVPAREIADVGGELEAKALVGVGKALDYTSEIVAKWYEREGNTQFDTARREAREKVNEFELTSFENADAHDKEYKKLRANIKKFAPKNKAGARKFQSWLDWASPALDKWSNELKIRMVKRNNTVDYFKNIASLATETDFDKAQTEARLLTQGAIDDKIRTPAQADSDFSKVMGDWLKTSVWNAAIRQATIDDEVIWGQVLTYLNQPKNTKGLPGDAVDSLIENAQTQHRIQTATHNDDVYWDTLRKLTKDRDSITEEDLVALVKPNSLTTDDYKEFMKMKAEGGLLSKPTVKTALTLFDNLKTMGGYKGKLQADMTIEEKRENAQRWADIKNDFIKWVEANPDATDEQIEKKQKELTKPVREEIVLNWLEKALLIKRRQFGFIRSELDQLVKKKIKELKKEDVWETMTDGEKETVRRAFYEGRTIQDVLDMVE